MNSFPEKSRKKKFTSMKKRILMARLHQHLQKQQTAGTCSNPEDIAIESADSKVHSIGSYSAILVSNLFDAEDTVDAEEEEEVMESIRTLASSFGAIESVSAIHDADQHHHSVAGYAIKVVFIGESSANVACKALHGMVQGGLPLVVTRLEDDAAMIDDIIESNTSSRVNIVAEKSSVSIPWSGYSAVLQLMQLIFPEDLEDEDETQEVLRNLQILCKVYGSIASVWLSMQPSSNKNSFDISTDQPSSLIHSNSVTSVIQDSSPVVEIEFESIIDAMTAAKKLHGTVIAGEILSLEIRLPSPDLALYDDTLHDMHWWRKHAISSTIHIDVQYGMLISKSEIPPSYITHKQLTVDRSTASTALDDELQTIILFNSIVDYFEFMSLYDDAFYHQCFFVQVKLAYKEQLPTCISLSDIIVLPHLASLSRAALCIQGFVSAEDMNSASSDEIAQMKVDILMLSGVHDSNAKIYYIGINKHDHSISSSSCLSAEQSIIGCVAYVDMKDVVKAMCHLDGFIVGGVAIQASIFYPTTHHMRDYQNMILSSPSLHADGDPSIECMSYKNDAIQSQDLSCATMKYADAVEKPHLPKHVMPNIQSIPVADEEINKLVHSMLDSLATFQKRLKEKDPIKSKGKLRFVVGMKQVINACKAGKVKLVLLAPDTEINEDVDKKLDSLLTHAQEKEIPILYTMTRRKLGKACQLSMRQSVVGVYDPNGVYDQFKKIVRYASTYNDAANIKEQNSATSTRLTAEKS